MTVQPAGTTVKERLLADFMGFADKRGRLSLKPEEFAKRHGLNGHDFTKNIEQLRKEGHIEIDWMHGWVQSIRIPKSVLNRVVLEQPAKPTGQAERILEWLRQRSPDAPMGAWVTVTLDQLATGTKIPRASANTVVALLAKEGKLELRRGKGRKITAMRLWLTARELRGPTQALTVTTPSPQALTVTTPSPQALTVVPPQPTTTTNGPAVEMPETPYLDHYYRARRWVRLMPEDDNPYASHNFVVDPIAEEALVLRELLEKALKR